MIDDTHLEHGIGYGGSFYFALYIYVLVLSAIRGGRHERVGIGSLEYVAHFLGFISPLPSHRCRAQQQRLMFKDL